MPRPCSRRTFLRVAAAAPLAIAGRSLAHAAAGTSLARGATVAIARARSYGPEAAAALRQSVRLLGGLGPLVRGKTVAVKVNLTGWPFQPVAGRAPGETFVTHGDTAGALAALLADAGARRIRFLDSVATALPFEEAVAAAGWDVRAVRAAGPVEFENTRNLGSGRRYAQLKVPGGGRVFSSFEVNHSYEEADVFVSLCKMKEHVTAGVTLSLKNLFGLPPNSLYGAETGEEKLGHRAPMHDAARNGLRLLPGERPGFQDLAAGARVPRSIVDLGAAWPVHLAIVEGIRTIRGGEGPWHAGVSPIDPGLIVAGWNAVSTDAVAMAAMGFDAHAPSFMPRPDKRENHVRMAEEAGLGTADLERIEVRGLGIAEARTPFRT